MAYPSTLTNAVGRRYGNWRTHIYLPCYLTQLLASLCSIGWFGICVFLLLDQLPYQAVELGLPWFWDHSFPSPRPTACQEYRVWPTRTLYQMPF